MKKLTHKDKLTILEWIIHIAAWSIGIGCIVHAI